MGMSSFTIYVINSFNKTVASIFPCANYASLGLTLYIIFIQTKTSMYKGV